MSEELCLYGVCQAVVYDLRGMLPMGDFLALLATAKFDCHGPVLSGIKLAKRRLRLADFNQKGKS